MALLECLSKVYWQSYNVRKKEPIVWCIEKFTKSCWSDVYCYVYNDSTSSGDGNSERDTDTNTSSIYFRDDMGWDKVYAYFNYEYLS